MRYVSEVVATKAGVNLEIAGFWVSPGFKMLLHLRYWESFYVVR